MKERPIIFSAPMVRALLEGRKTRRIVKLPKKHSWGSGYDGQIIFDDGSAFGSDFSVDELRCPYGKLGDSLWVRETHLQTTEDEIHFRADGKFPDGAAKMLGGWRPSIFMPYRFSRILLEITAVRVERLQEITPTDAKAEGVSFGNITDQATGEIDRDAVEAYEHLWESINGPGSWDSNPFVWVVSFQKRLITGETK